MRSGIVSLIGRPNVGKSTLLNRILGEKISIISDKPQTTRHRILGVKHLPGGQIVFLDTPGIHRGRTALNERMVRTALATLEEVDLVFLLEEPEEAGAGMRDIVEILKRGGAPVFLIVNKIDLISKFRLIPIIDRLAKEMDFAEVIPISALGGTNVDHLIEVTLARLPEGEPMFPEDVVTDQPVRFLAAEIVREKILKRTREEVPHAVAVEIEEFREEPKRNLAVIRAVIFVERESQKGIVIGRAGKMLKEVGEEARVELEALLGVRIFLDLFVKVREDWRSDPSFIAEVGY